MKIVVVFLIMLLSWELEAQGNQINPDMMKGLMENISTFFKPLMDMTTIPGKSYNNPASSCNEILTQCPDCPSGYYWVCTIYGTPVYVKCDMDVYCDNESGWMALIDLDMYTPESICPDNLIKWSHGALHGCMKPKDTQCASIHLPMLGVRYSKVCGKAKGYQWGKTDAFTFCPGSDCTSIDSAYVDGISITYSEPRKHIWTMAAAQHEVAYPNPASLCPCTNVRNRMNSLLAPPKFVGNDYFCETGTVEKATAQTLYGTNPLWDGQGCGSLSTCCTHNNPPWFVKSLCHVSCDDIEVRLCANSNSIDKKVILKELVILVK